VRYTSSAGTKKLKPRDRPERPSDQQVPLARARRGEADTAPPCGRLPTSRLALSRSFRGRSAGAYNRCGTALWFVYGGGGESSHLDEERLRRLIDAGRSLVAERDLDRLLERLLAVARELTGARYAAVRVLDERREALADFITWPMSAPTHSHTAFLPVTPE
jgi:hypothetical protein